jgi:hypothetical protein
MWGRGTYLVPAAACALLCACGRAGFDRLIGDAAPAVDAPAPTSRDRTQGLESNDAGGDAAPVPDAAPAADADPAPDAAVALPCQVDRQWQADFSSDPTQQDLDGDGLGDWVIRGGSPFPTAELQAGLWRSASGLALDTYPKLNFTAPTHVMVRMRHTGTPSSPVKASGFEGAVFWINVDYASDGLQALYASVVRTTDTTQVVRVFGKTTNSNTVQILGPRDVGADFVQLELTVDPAADTVSAVVDGTSLGSTTLPRQTPLNNDDRFATLIAPSTQGEFDEVRVIHCQP